MTHQMRRHPDYTNDQERLLYQIIDDLKKAGWNPDERTAYIIAQQSHGCLRAGQKDWEYRSALRRWPLQRPKFPPGEPAF